MNHLLMISLLRVEIAANLANFMSSLPLTKSSFLVARCVFLCWRRVDFAYLFSFFLLIPLVCLFYTFCWGIFSTCLGQIVIMIIANWKLPMLANSSQELGWTQSHIQNFVQTELIKWNTIAEHLVQPFEIFLKTAESVDEWYFKFSFVDSLSFDFDVGTLWSKNFFRFFKYFDSLIYIWNKTRNSHYSHYTSDSMPFKKEVRIFSKIFWNPLTYLIQRKFEILQKWLIIWSK